MSDQAIENEIQAKGLTASSITPQKIQEIIAGEVYFTAGQAAAMVDAPASVALTLLTFCVLTLRNGFTVTGESACASPENFDADLGRTIARQNAEAKIWALEGYLLKQTLFDAGVPLAPIYPASTAQTREDNAKF